MATADAFAAILQIPGVQELLNTSITNARQQGPLRTGATQTALGMLPNSSFGGSSARPDISAIPQAAFSTPPPSGSALATALKYLAAGGAGALAGGLGRNGASGDLGAFGSFLKNLFHRGNGNASNPYGSTSISGNYDPFGFDPNDPVSGGVDYSQLPGYGTPLPPTGSDPGLHDSNNDWTWGE